MVPGLGDTYKWMNKFVFSDEICFQFSSDSHRVRVWRRHGDRSNLAATMECPPRDNAASGFGTQLHTIPGDFVFVFKELSRLNDTWMMYCGWWHSLTFRRHLMLDHTLLASTNVCCNVYKCFSASVFFWSFTNRPHLWCDWTPFAHLPLLRSEHKQWQIVD